MAKSKPPAGAASFESFGQTVCRVVIRIAIAVVAIGGTAVGVTVGAAYATERAGTHGAVVGACLGVGLAFAGCVVAALTSVFLEIANSLRDLVDARKVVA